MWNLRPQPTVSSLSTPSPVYLFQAGDVLCRACRNIKPENIGRYALGGVVQEAVWTGESTDMVVDDFVRRRSDDIVSTLNAAIAKHIYVVSCVNSIDVRLVVDNSSILTRFRSYLNNFSTLRVQCCEVLLQVCGGLRKRGAGVGRSSTYNRTIVRSGRHLIRRITRPPQPRRVSAK